MIIANFDKPETFDREKIIILSFCFQSKYIIILYDLYFGSILVPFVPLRAINN